MAHLTLKDEILERLSRQENFFLVSPATLLEGLPEREERYTALLEALCDLSLSSTEAASYLHTVSEHQQHLSESLGRPVDLRVALLDFWSQNDAPVTGAKLVDVKNYLRSIRLAYVDGLTGLHNRRYLEEFMHRELTRSERHQLSFSVLFMDIDDFKAINDTRGHAYGDEVLKRISDQLKDTVRREDLAARYGGEEFVVVMPQTDSDGAYLLANRLLDTVRSYTGDQRVTLSGGISTYPHHGTKMEELFINADRSLYDAKMGGKDQVRLFNSDQRRDPRYQCSLDVLYSFDGTSYNAGVTRDVSRSGLCFVTDRSIEVGQSLSLLIRSRKHERTFLVETRIMWVNDAPEDPNQSAVRLGARYNEHEVNSVEELLREAFETKPVR